MNNLVKKISEGALEVTNVLNQVFLSGSINEWFCEYSPVDGYFIDEVYQVKSSSSDSDPSVTKVDVSDGEGATTTISKSGQAKSGSHAITSFISDIRGNSLDEIRTTVISRWGDTRSIYVVPTQPTVNSCIFLTGSKAFTINNKSCIVSFSTLHHAGDITLTTNNRYYVLNENRHTHCYYFPKASEISFTLDTGTINVAVGVYEF